jgi:acetyl/propionyl-CoA carboxylase alpha subunit/acetyl-CoA carboxylase carboxyltransferase component
MPNEFKRVAIADRGEAAMRFVNAVREYNQERGTDLRTIALFTEPDRGAMFVREADEAFDLGPAMFIDPRDGRPRSAYLDLERVEAVLLACGAEAVWPGWGFAAEDPAFAERLARRGIVFLGPPVRALRRFADKIASKKLADEAGVPTAAWSGGPVDSPEAAETIAARLGFPVLVKSAIGGGGRGIRRADSADALAEAFRSARAESRRAFGDPRVFIERLVEGARHVEVPFVADAAGAAWALPARDCSLQRRFQKVLEETPAPGVAEELVLALQDATLRLGRAAGYAGVGTAEFLLDPKSGGFVFLDGSARLQVGHPITEAVTGVDLVKLQIHLARGGRLEGPAPRAVGHAVGVRLNAEDPEANFVQTPGRFVLFRLAAGPGVRIDRGVTEGDQVPAEFDSMVAKVVGYGRDRAEAFARLHRALNEISVVMEGGTTNRAFLLDLISQPELARGELDSGWLARVFSAAPRPFAGEALVMAAIEAYEADRRVERERFYHAAARLRPEVSRESGRMVELRHRGHAYRVRACRVGPDEYRLELDGRRVQARLHALSRFERWLSVGGRRHRAVCVPRWPEIGVEIDGAAHRFSRGDVGIVRAESPAMVVSLAVKPGDTVSAGATLAVVEAMKMETSVLSPFSGRVRELLVTANTQVGPGTGLVQIDPDAGADASSSPRLELARESEPRQATPRDRALAHLEDVRRLILGFELDPADVKRLAAEYVALAEEWPASAERSALEDAILEAFADLASLFRRQAAPEEGEDLESLSSGEYFLTYLRAPGDRGARLPEAFLDRLQRALGHYGVAGLEPTDALLDALLWICKSRQRVDAQVSVLVSILERRLGTGPVGTAAQDRDFVLLLDRLIDASENRHPSLCDVAREVRYRLFDKPLYEEQRQRSYQEAASQLDALRAAPTGPEAPARIAALVACPQPLQTFVSAHLEAETPPVRERLLEVLARRYYRIRGLGEVKTLTKGGRSLLTAAYHLDQSHLRLFATHAAEPEIDLALADLGALVSGVVPGEEAVADLYLWRLAPIGAVGENAAMLLAQLRAAAPQGPVRRLGITLAAPGNGLWTTAVQHFTFRQVEDGWREDVLYRGFHPMIGKRLHFERLVHFDIERLPSAEDIYLFRGVARTNPKDERLFAFAEVRDATTSRDAEGRLVQVPHLERVVFEALAGIRLFQSRRRPEERLHWNHVFVDVWPPLDHAIEDVEQIARKLAPATEGLGIEGVYLRADLPDPSTGEMRSQLLHIGRPGGAALSVRVLPATVEPIEPLSEYGQKVVRMRQRGLLYPYEILRLIAPAEGARGDFPPGHFQEMDLDADGRLVDVSRPPGKNSANVVVGVIKNITERCPEGMTRVVLLGDPSREMGSVAEPECRRILCALDLAERMGVPLEWFTLSAGAKIAMESGTENMDWISQVLRRLIQFTQGGGEVNIMVCGINVGAQPYWNAEATMLMHTKGILVMIPEAAMVLTGKTALDYSGSVSAEDNLGIGGYERVMGPNGQAQYWARDLGEACRILFRHYDHCYLVPGERFPRRATTTDPRDRDVRTFAHEGGDAGFSVVGDIFSDETNPQRKKPFEIRRVMAAVADQDHPPLERWAGMRDAETSVVWDAHLGGIPVAMLGFESHAIPRLGFVPTDGPEQWTSGTLFPRSSKKTARAVNAASGNRPLVILANLSGFDGSPESMRRMQLEYGAEIGRAVVNFRGPIVFCVVSRYHGGAFVVFSKALHDNMEVTALEGTYASVIGGAPAAAVVFAREVDTRTKKDPRVTALDAELAAAPEAEKRKLRARLAETIRSVRSERLGQVADEFDATHSVGRALRVGSLDRILPARELRPYLIDAVERGMARELERVHPPGAKVSRS